MTFRYPNTTELERKLELLEARFTNQTTPISKHVSGFGSSTSPVLLTTTLGFTTGTATRSSTASGSSPTLLVQARSNSPSSHISNSPHSEHSFGFDAPSGNSNFSQSVTQPLARSKRVRRRSSLPLVNAAAAKHMQKVVAAASALASGAVTSQHATDSNAATRLTSHVHLDRDKPIDIDSSHVQETSANPVSSRVTPLPRQSNQSSNAQGTVHNNNSNLTTRSNQGEKKRKSIPMKKDHPSVREMTQPAIVPKRICSRAVRNVFSPSTNQSPKRKATTTTMSSSKLGTKRETRNTSLYDFFGSATLTRSLRRTSEQPPLTTDRVPTTPQSSNERETLDFWMKKCEVLEKACLDKEEQLKAVSNNRTMVHHALQTALSQRDDEIRSIRARADARQVASQAALEELIRSEATRAARELREKLAADGARLGRMVHTRAGMRTVETWEDGHASKQLDETKLLLQDKFRKMERRRIAAESAARKFLEEKENELASDEVDGLVVRSKLEAMEAIESVRLHLSNLRQEEKELLQTEKRLNEEKAVHIRALKRVASEDYSRFRDRPKLNDRYVLTSLLGKGGFSEVWRAFDLVDLREVAVKIHQLDPRWSDGKKENYTKHVSREYEIHRNVRHPRIVSLYDVFEIDNNSFATVLECCSGKDLDLLLKERRRLPERDARAILLQILSGMQYLCKPSLDGSHKGIIHYDLKPGNILFDENGDAKITDFGLSKIMDVDSSESMELTSQGAGTYWYLPPECFVMDENVRISNKVDVWSIGVIFYQMLFGKRPFGDGQSQDKILADQTMLNAREVSFPEKIPVSAECKQFIRACLTFDQSFRPNVAQLCENPYVVEKITLVTSEP